MSDQPIKNVVLTVGNSMMGDDGAGPMLYDMMTQRPISDWSVIDGGPTPENYAHVVRELKPELLVLVDAADMELSPGEIRIIDADSIAEMFIMSTHNMPLNFLIDQLKQDIPQVVFIGIQPSIVSFAFPMTEEVKQAVKTVYNSFTDWQQGYEFEHI